MGAQPSVFTVNSPARFTTASRSSSQGQDCPYQSLLHSGDDPSRERSYDKPPGRSGRCSLFRPWLISGASGLRRLRRAHRLTSVFSHYKFETIGEQSADRLLNSASRFPFLKTGRDGAGGRFRFDVVLFTNSPVGKRGKTWRRIGRHVVPVYRYSPP